MISFGERDYMTPYELISADLDTIETVFVKPFSNSPTRWRLFDAFKAYLTELKAALNTPLEIWVNGSFTTHKPTPNDVDFVIFVDRQVATIYRDIINQFRQRRYVKKSMTDGYFVEIVPEEHPDYILYLSDRQDWHRAFAFGRNERKGYIQIML